MKKYNCPDCVFEDTTNFEVCLHCKRNNKPREDYYFVKYTHHNSANDDPCITCSNDPRNGGSGICFCTIGLRNTY